MYDYKARITKVIDGDTLKLEVDLGFNIRTDIVVRLARINAPEMRAGYEGTEEYKKGIAAKEFIESQIQKYGPDIILSSDRDRKEKYGRYLAEIFFVHQNIKLNLNDMLWTRGLAKPK